MLTHTIMCDRCHAVNTSRKGESHMGFPKAMARLGWGFFTNEQTFCPTCMLKAKIHPEDPINTLQRQRI